MSMPGTKIKVSKVLYDRLREAAAAKGYPSAEEFAVHVLEQATAGHEESLSEEEVKKRLRGLGYLE